MKINTKDEQRENWLNRNENENKPLEEQKKKIQDKSHLNFKENVIIQSVTNKLKNKEKIAKATILIEVSLKERLQALSEKYGLSISFLIGYLIKTQIDEFENNMKQNDDE